MACGSKTDKACGGSVKKACGGRVKKAVGGTVATPPFMGKKAGAAKGATKGGKCC